MKRTMKRTAGISWEQWHRMVMMQSLQMMVISGVVSRADLNPPLVHLNSAQCGQDGQDGEETSAGSMAELGWFARMFFSRERLLRHHH